MTQVTKENWELTTEEIVERIKRATTPSEGFTPLEMAADLLHTGAMDANKWLHDVWRITLKRGEKSMAFDFRTGTGHRRVPKRVIARMRATEMRYTTADKSVPEMAAYRGLAIPCVPSVYSVLSSVIEDGTAVGTDFVEWCENYGYDTDSRKALDNYEACIRTGRDIRRVLGDLYAQFDGVGF
jgi:hypothetical protein